MCQGSISLPSSSCTIRVLAAAWCVTVQGLARAEEEVSLLRGVGYMVYERSTVLAKCGTYSSSSS
jgi:hypothetical protein